MKQTPKRFIAGAVCPRCGLMDKIRTFRTDEKEFRECVNCDFADEIIFKPAVRELETRVTKVEEEKQVETQVVKIIGKDGSEVR